jgi:hypothetical protein
MYSGDSKNIIISITDVTDLAGATAKWAVKKRIDGIENEILKTTENGITISGNEILVKLTPTDTLNINGIHYYECELTDAQGNISTVKTGYVSFKQSGV